MQIKNTLALFATAALLSGVIGSADAATVEYVGGQTNLEALTNDPAVGWRNATTAKPLDIDGDNILGTDGYRMGSASYESLPSYVSSATVAGNHNQLRGTIDDPLDPTGADLGAAWSGGSGSSGTFGTFVFQGTTLATETLRLGVLYDSDWNLGWGNQTFTLTQTVGGTDSDTTPTLTLAGDGLDVVYFDVTGIQDGDTFVLSYTDVDINWAQITGVTFDTAPVPEPGSLALLGLGGLMMIKRRRRG